MRSILLTLAAGVLIVTTSNAQAPSPGGGALAQAPGRRGGPPAQVARPPDVPTLLVARLDLERYKATIKALTKFGDRLAGTDRNRAAVDWIEQQLKSYGCSGTERLHYVFSRTTPPGGANAAGRGATANAGPTMPPGRPKGNRGSFPNVANLDPNKQPDPVLRALDAQSAADGPRDDVYCTKVGTTHPEEMYIVAGHMDGRGFGEAANDDASGTAIVMELARIYSSPDVHTDRSIRFILWNNEENGYIGASAYIQQRQALQGKEDPPGSGRYPEPKWLGMIQHDMMLFDHGMPHPDGSVSSEQRAEAGVAIEFQANSTMAAQSQALAWTLRQANESYAVDYPARVGPHMAATDSNAFQNIVPAVSLRENESTAEINNGWDPHHHQPTDLYATFSDKDFRLGLNAAETTLSAVAFLTGATLSGGPGAR